MTHSFHLVQRLTAQDRPNKTGFDALFSLDYMGSSEFEWGAIPKALKSLRAAKSLTLTTAEATHRGVTRTIHVVGPKADLADRVASLNAWLADDRPRGKEASYFPESMLGEASDYQARTNAWWAIDADLMWSLDPDVAAGLWTGVTGTPAPTAVR